jgi:hypothetical protein
MEVLCGLHWWLQTSKRHSISRHTRLRTSAVTAAAASLIGCFKCWIRTLSTICFTYPERHVSDLFRSNNLIIWNQTMNFGTHCIYNLLAFQNCNARQVRTFWKILFFKSNISVVLHYAPKSFLNVVWFSKSNQTPLDFWSRFPPSFLCFLYPCRRQPGSCFSSSIGPACHGRAVWGLF